MPALPRWMHRLRPFAVPIWVAIGILVSVGVYQTLVGRRFDSEILNAPNLMSETIQHVFMSGDLLRAGRGDRRARRGR